MTTNSSSSPVPPALTPATEPPTSALAPFRPAIAAMAVARPRLTVVKVFRMLGSPVRWRVFQRLVEVGQPMSVSQLASRERLSPDAMSRHLQLMEKAGVLASHSGVDRRCSCYFVPTEFQQEAGWLDFGVVKVRREET